ncbi:MAG: type III secretion protein V [Bradymonadia bacterium]
MLAAAGLVVRRTWRAEPGPRAQGDPIAPVAAFGLTLHPDATRGLPGGAAAVIDAARQQLRDVYGVHLDAVHLDTDARDLAPGEYRIEVREARVAVGQLPARGVFVTPPPSDAATTAPHPLTSAPGAWVDVGAGLDAATFLAQHLVAAWRRSGSAILGVQDVADATSRLEAIQPALVRAVVPRVASLPRLADLMQRLLNENVPVRDLQAVLEVLAHCPVGVDTEAQLQRLRCGLAPLISQQAAPDGRLEALYPDPAIEARLRDGMPLSPEAADALLDDIEDALRGHPRAVLVTGADVRLALRAQIASWRPGLMVVAVEELTPDLKAVSVGLVG